MNLRISVQLPGAILGVLLLSSTGWAESGLVGHWRLQGDCRDSSGRGNHGANHGATLDPRDGAEFNGVDSRIEVPHSAALDLGHGPFSIAVWACTESILDDTPGDLLSKYDLASRTGVNLGIHSYAGAASSQANWGNLAFGIDAARIDCEWTDCGRPGDSRHICALAVHDGRLYAGTLESGPKQAGRVFCYQGGTEWLDCGSPDKCNAVFALAVFQGKLYAGVARRDTTHDGQAPSANQNPGGRVYRYDGGSKWTDCGRLGNADSVYALAVFGGRLYATTLYWPAKGLYRYEGGDRWTFCGHPGQRVEPLAVHNGCLYAASFDGGEFFRYDGQSWTRLKPIPDTTQTYSIGVYQGRLHVGTWPNGLVFRHDPPDTWTFCGRLGAEQEIQAMVAYNGQLFAGTLPSAKVYRYAGGSTWSYTGSLDSGGGLYRRAWSLAVFNGKLFCGTMPSGRVWSLEVGRCATWDTALGPGWRHIAAVRDSDRLRLYVDGQCVATSSEFQADHYHLSNPAPLMIGLGQQAHFKGRLKDLRIYDRALGPSEIQALLKRP
ncbi:MAG: LamG domain-containing protein [Pirellulales bacterium]|nr:LamG domain-containing protein [Pirellulales bacterium]